MRRRLALAMLAIAALACTEPVTRVNAPRAVGVSPVASTIPGDVVIATPPKASGDPELDREIAKMLQRVAQVRKLSVKTPVAGRRLGRDEVIDLIMTKTEKELPKGVLEAQGELLRGLGLIDPSYDFVGGIYALIRENLAGFYDQHRDQMFILDDMSEASTTETLAHELVHALQDQHFDLTTLLDYQPGDSDRVTAGHALAEGDAMSAMFELTLGDARKISPRMLRVAMVASVAMSGDGAETPRVLQASLIAPYVDGFRFVQELRARGGWSSVDDAYRSLPTTTEQLLHVDKYDAKEPALKLPVPALPAGFVQQDQDVLGEQGLRMVLEQWAIVKTAAKAAAGWGGDRFVVGRKSKNDGATWAAAWVIRFDNAAEGAEAAKLMHNQHSVGCTERADLGPFAWQRKNSDIAIVVGPFDKSADGTLASAATCADAQQWLAKLL